MGHWIFIAVLGIFAGRGFAVVDPSNPDCGSMEVTKCLQSTQNQLFFPDTQQKLKEYCKHLMAGLECTKNIIEHCVNEAERQMYNNLTKDMLGMNVALCTPGSPFSTRFLKHVDCFKHVSDRFQTCSERYLGNIVVVQSLAKEEQSGMTCCSVHEYNRCMRNAVEGRCEEDAQKLVEETVVTALKQSIGYCKQLGDIPTSNCMKRFSPGSTHETSNLNDENAAGRYLVTTHSLLVLATVIALVWS